MLTSVDCRVPVKQKAKIFVPLGMAVRMSDHVPELEESSQIKLLWISDLGLLCLADVCFDDFSSHFVLLSHILEVEIGQVL